jgi:selenium metabolism protein YedF
MKSFLGTLNELETELWRLIFVNSGVYLTIEGSETYQLLQELEKEGRSILVCGTCLDHFNLVKRHRVGEATNMLDIVTAMQLADKIIKI